MKKIISAFAIIISTLPAAAQKEKKVSTYLELIYQHTIYDKTINNNPWGAGLGIQTLIKPGGKFSPLLDLSAFAYLQDDKVARMDENDNALPDVRSMINLFAGMAYKPSSNNYFSIAGGPSFLTDQTLFGIKSAFAFYFSPSKKWKGQISYTNVFNRGIEGSEGSFGSVSFAIGLRLF
jgi:hypothetical protein